MFLTDAEYVRQYPESLAEDGVTVVRYSPPDGPKLRKSSTYATVQMHAFARDLRKEYYAAERDLTRRLLDSVGATIRDELTDPVTGHEHLKPHHILAHVQSRYGELPPKQLQDLRASLSEPFTSARTFEADAVRMRTRLAQLERAGCPESEFAKMLSLGDAVAHLPDVTEAYMDYLPVRDPAAGAVVRQRLRVHSQASRGHLPAQASLFCRGSRPR
jgi:hypothetical protein